AAQGVDGVAIISGTFHLGHLALLIEKAVRKPILLWGFPELPYDGGKIRLNSVCGVNLNASNLYKAGCDQVACHIGMHMDRAWLDAVRMKAAVSGAHVGLAGYRADGFFNLDVSDTELFQKYGVLIDHYELNQVYDCELTETILPEKRLREIFDCTGVTREQTGQVSRLADSMEQFMRDNALDALAVRCWPEFAAQFGIAPCAAMSILNAGGRTVGCEGDIEGTLSMLACNAVAEEPAFLADLSQVDFAQDCALLWHCGVAPYSLWDGCSVRSLDTYFAGGKGVTVDFVLKSGPVTVMRTDTARGRTRVFLAQGEAIPMEKELKGSYCKVKFDQPVRRLLDTVTSNGIAHHLSMIYGDYAAAVEKYADMMGFELIR
ncbi:MAG: fucose isomerase, partial [Clostridiales bacterium]|nr:fucose isomerase [Clostridiales bacterium]